MCIMVMMIKVERERERKIAKRVRMGDQNPK
jgi:hypothetical protein